MAVNCAILSYNGTVYFGFSGDVHAAPDLRRLEKLLQESFTELRHAVGIKPPQKKRVRRKRSVVSAALPAKTMPAPVPIMTGVSPVASKREPEPAPNNEQEKALTQFVVA